MNNNHALNKFYRLAKEKFFPLCRSITGTGTYKTLKYIKKEFKNLKIYKIKSELKYMIGKSQMSGISKMDIF